MLSTKSPFALALLVPLVAAAIPAEAAKRIRRRRVPNVSGKPMKPWRPKALAPLLPTRTLWQDAYRQCCFKAGIQP